MCQGRQGPASGQAGQKLCVWGLVRARARQKLLVPPCQVGTENFRADLTVNKRFQMWAGGGVGGPGRVLEPKDGSEGSLTWPETPPPTPPKLAAVRPSWVLMLG